MGRATSTRILPEPWRRQRTSERDRGTSVEVSGAQCAYNCACGGFLWQPSRRSSSASNRRRHRFRWPWHAEMPTSETITLRANPTCHCGGLWRGIGERWLRRPDAMDGGSCARYPVVHRTGSCAYSHGRAAPGVQLCVMGRGLRSPIANRPRRLCTNTGQTQTPHACHLLYRYGFITGHVRFTIKIARARGLSWRPRHWF